MTETDRVPILPVIAMMLQDWSHRPWYPHRHIRHSREPLPEFHARVSDLYDQTLFANRGAPLAHYVNRVGEMIYHNSRDTLSPPLKTLIRSLFIDLLDDNDAILDFPEYNPDRLGTPSQQRDLRDELRDLEYRVTHADAIHDELSQIVAGLVSFIIREHLPPNPFDDFPATNPDDALTIPLITLIARPRDLVADIYRCFYAADMMPHEDAPEARAFRKTRSQFTKNLLDHAQLTLEELETKLHKIKMPEHSDLAPVELVRVYLRNTPFHDFLLEPRLPMTFPDDARFAHHWIVGGSGHGKTTALQYLIAQDLDRVAEGTASLLVMDSQRDLISTIARQACFAPGGTLYDRLVLIDPTDVAYPLALNLFDMAGGRLDQFDIVERTRLENSARELATYVISAILDDPMTPRQRTLFNFSVELLFAMPGATLETFYELLRTEDLNRFAPHLDNISGYARNYFLGEFMDTKNRHMKGTKEEVAARLNGILSQNVFANMFSGATSKLDMFAELNAGKVILINTDKSFLQETGTKLFGRLMLAMVAQAAAERATIAREQRLAAFFYIDECHDYVAGGDEKITTILEQARKMRVGTVLAHQYIAQLRSDTLTRSLAANTSIKMAGGVDDSDARSLAPNLRSTPQFLMSQRQFQFATYVKGMTGQAISLTFPVGTLDNRRTMSDADFSAIRHSMRDRYAGTLERSGNRSDPDQSIADQPTKAQSAPDQSAHERPTSHHAFEELNEEEFDQPSSTESENQ